MNKLRSLSAAIAFAAIGTSLILASRTQAQTWSGASSGLWSTGTNWVGDSAPTTDGSAAITFSLNSSNIVSTVDAAWSANGAINGLTFSQPSGSATVVSLLSGAGSSLSIGSGGISSTLAAGRTINLSTATQLTANQTWNTGAGVLYLGGGNAGTNVGSLSAASGIKVTKSGAGSLIFRGLASSTFAGNLVLNQGSVAFYNSAALQSLGTGTLTIENNGTTTANFSSGAVMTADQTFSNKIVFNDISTGTFNINAGGGSAGLSLTFNGDWSSSNTLMHGIFLASNVSPTAKDFSTAFQYRISGNNSGLVSGVAANAVNVRSGVWVLDNANALGAGNSLSVRIGEISTSVAGVVSALWTNGYDVSSNITTALNGSTGGSQVVSIGNSNSTGTANFTGNLTLVTGTSTQVPSVFLVSKTGSRTNFRGNITDSGVGAAKSSISADGGGTVSFSGNNTYSGSTSVINGTTLLVTNTAGSGTGVGAVTVGNGSTLGGTGFIAPGTSNGVTIQGGGLLAPGDGGIGNLTFDGGATSGTLLTLQDGARFQFQLGTANTSDSISFFNYADGDFSLFAGGNSIDITGAQAGTYTLFKFYSDSGTTATASGISSGLNIGSGLTGFDYMISYDTLGQINLVVTAVPEPSKIGLLFFSAGVFVFLAKRNQSQRKHS